MRTKLLGVFAAVLLLAACETAPETTGAAAGSGQQAGAGVGSQATTARTVAPGSAEDLVANVGDRVFFDLDKYTLKPEARAQIEKWAAWLRQHPQNRVTIEGHADERGTREYNLALGARRANSAKEHLVALGIAANRLNTISYGEEKPQALGSNEQAWSQNRRGVLTLTTGAPRS
jgi:peptidoglycan-associated lipoprotein